MLIDMVKVPLSGVSVLYSSVRVGGHLESPARLKTDRSSPSSALSGGRVHARVYADLCPVDVRGEEATKHLREVVCGR